MDVLMTNLNNALIVKFTYSLKPEALTMDGVHLDGGFEFGLDYFMEEYTVPETSITCLVIERIKTIRQ